MAEPTFEYLVSGEWRQDDGSFDITSAEAVRERRGDRLSPEMRRLVSSKGGQAHSAEHLSEIGKKGGSMGRHHLKGQQKWRCLITGKVLGPGPLTLYQRARGIDTGARERVE